jgi:hypothetical protein
MKSALVRKSFGKEVLYSDVTQCDVTNIMDELASFYSECDTERRTSELDHLHTHCHRTSNVTVENVHLEDRERDTMKTQD